MDIVFGSKQPNVSVHTEEVAVAENLNVEHWYAIQVRPNSEKVVCRHLQSQNIEHLFPTSLLHKAQKSNRRTEAAPIFPGYLFVHLSWPTGPRLYKVPHVIRVLGLGKEPTPIDEREVDAIRLVVSSSEERMPWRHFIRGEHVTLVDGPLKGLEGIFLEEKHKNLVIVSVPLLQRAMAVVVEREWLAPATEFYPTIRFHASGHSSYSSVA